ncbi:hypothetical protein CLOM_g22615 [Closterium sp. NIES-68]|nr:hypothetical protein CLOM_g22615 [Closterium sp. NIES-68]
MLTSDSMLSQGQLAQSGMDVAQTEWEVFMCYRALRELSGQFYHRLPTPVKNELRDAGLCHYMAIIRSPEGQLIQFDFGPRGKDVEWRPASNNSSSSNSNCSSSSSSLQIAGGSGSNGGFRRDQLLQCTMSYSKPTTPSPTITTNTPSTTPTTTNCSCKEETSSGSGTSSSSRDWNDYSSSSSGCSCAASTSFRQQAQRLACNALLQHSGGHGSGMASLTLHQMDLAEYAIPPPNGEIREELIGALPETAVRVGVTRMSIADMRAFYSSLDFNYLLNRNDCRHFVDAFVHFTTGVDRASARLIRANMDLRMRARPWQPVDPVIIICQRILEKENTYRVFTACHAAFTSLSSAVLLKVGIQSGRLHQRLARVVQSSAMFALRRALPQASAMGRGVMFRAAGGPLGMLSAAMAAGAVAAAAAVAATGMRVRGMASRQLKQLVGLPHRPHWQKPKPALQLAPAPPPAPLPQTAVTLATVAAGAVGVGAVQPQAALAAVSSGAVAVTGSVSGAAVTGTGPGGVAVRIEVPVAGPCSGALVSPVSPKSPKMPAEQQQQQVQPCSPQPQQGQGQQQLQQQQQGQQSQQQQVNAATWPLGSGRSRKAKATTELKAERKTRKAAPAGSKKTLKSGKKAPRSVASSSSSSNSSCASKGGNSKGGNSKGGVKAASSEPKGLPGLLAHFSPLSSLLVVKAAALGNGLKTCLDSRPLLNDPLQLAALP